MDTARNGFLHPLNLLLFLMSFGKRSLPQGTALPTLAGRERHQKCGRAGRFIKAVLLAAGKLAATLRQVIEIGRARVGKECRSRWSPYH